MLPVRYYATSAEAGDERGTSRRAGHARQRVVTTPVAPALPTEKECFRLLFEHNLDPVFIIDTGACIVALNPAACSLLAQGEESLVGSSFLKLLDRATRPAAKKALNKLLAAPVTQGEWRLRTTDGRSVDIEFSMQANLAPGLHLLLLRDVSARKQAEQERLARQAAERAAHATSRFLTLISHELRTPLHCILGYAELLESDNLLTDQQESVAEILVSARHILQVVGSALDLNRIESGHLNLSLGAVNASDLLVQVSDMVKPMAAKRGQHLKIVTAGLEKHNLIADEQQLRQALLNLLSNAVKYGYEGSEIVVSYRQMAIDRIRLQVSDEGPGISAANQQRLFRPFERLDVDSSVVEGSGLGLIITKELVAAMGGVVGVDSAPGVGSTFWIELALIPTRRTGHDVQPSATMPMFSMGDQPDIQ